MPTNHWMIVSSAENFEISRSRGFLIQGIKSRHRKKAERMEPGDRVLYYLTGVQQFGGTASITSGYFEDHQPIWVSKKKGEEYPFRFEIKPDVVLEPGAYVDAKEIVPHLDYVKRWPAEHWHLAFQGNVHLFSEKDFSFVESRLVARRSEQPASTPTS
ncbi:MAG: EVE domain-containing protein [Dehalococcoidia bacterium]